MTQAPVIVVGGGAAGLLCAGTMAKAGLPVVVVEGRERPARKILVTGKGRCNLTNSCTPEEFLQGVHTNPKFLFSAIGVFPPRRTMELFENLGVPLKIERGRRVFPVSDRAMDIADALVSYCRKGGARLRPGEKVRALALAGGAISGVVLEKGEFLPAQEVVLATGGMSYPATGSDGSGYALAQQVGHQITPLRASLVRVDCQEEFCRSLAGLSLRNVTLTLTKGGVKRPLYQELGEMLFTHTGVSGPLVLSASAYLDGPVADYLMTIDLKPGLSEEQLDTRILRDLAENKNRDLGNLLTLLLPRAMIPVVLGQAGLSPHSKGNQVTRLQRQALAGTVKGLVLHPAALGPLAEAIVTAGGVAVGEVNPRTMASRLVPGLSFAGEILDVDGFTGGYNLQIAFATGYAAAMGVAERWGL